MAKYINDGATGYEPDLDNLVQAARGNGLSTDTDCAVTAQSSPNMTVQVSSGTLQYDAVTTSIAAVSSLAISTSDPTNPRIDLIKISSAGVVAAVAGTPSSTPKPPALASDSVLIAYVSVAAAASNIQNSNISIRRLRTTIAANPQATNPNLLPNSDFARRTIWSSSLAEVFADTSGYVKVDGGTAPTVGSNILTFGAANNNLAWCNQSFVWRDGRASATFKAVATAGFYSLKWRIDASNDINVQMNAGNFLIQKVIAGTPTTVSTVAQALTLNRWYFLEIEKQGTTIIGKLWDTTVTTPGTLKSASTLLQTLTGTVSDAGVQVGAHIGITSDQAAAQWGGIATGNGGVYVETPLPEAQVYLPAGTTGGQAWGYDDSVDAGPLGRQFAFRMYVPAASRIVQGQTLNVAAPVLPSTVYTFSAYLKTSGIGGSGPIIRANIDWLDNTGLNTVGGLINLTDAGETSWTRKSITVTSPATAKYVRYYIQGNPSSTATGTGYVGALQLELGPALTAWRNASQDLPLYLIDQKRTTAAAVDWSNSDTQPILLTGNFAFTFAAMRAGTFYTLVLKQDSTGTRIPTWPTSVKWPGGTAPVLTTTPGKTDIITFYYDGEFFFGTSVLSY